MLPREIAIYQILIEPLDLLLLEIMTRRLKYETA